MNKEDLYIIQNGDTGQRMAEGLTKNFEGILDSIPDVSGFITSTQADGKYATLAQIGDIDAILDSINGESV